MEDKEKGGRKAHGQNGRKHQGHGDCRLLNRDVRYKSLYDISQPKPNGSVYNGSCVIDGHHKIGQTQINTCTYNTRTLRTEESLESLLDELQNFKWDIIGLCETKREGEGIEELTGGAWLYNMEKQKKTRKQRELVSLSMENLKTM